MATTTTTTSMSTETTEPVNAINNDNEQESPPSCLLVEFGPSIWTVEGPVVNFFGAPYPTRMVLIQLDDGNVWVWSPVKLTDQLRTELSEKKLDKIAYVVSPNKIHHIFLKEWQVAFPDSKFYAPAGLKERQVAKDITFDAVITDNDATTTTTSTSTTTTTTTSGDIDTKFPFPYENEIAQVIFKGSFFMEEIIFYHKKSKTAIVADLIQRFPESDMEGFMGTLMKLDNLVGPDGGTPRDYRFTFLLGKEQARKARDIIVDSWEPKNLVIAHGECVTDGTATSVIDKAFQWVENFFC